LIQSVFSIIYFPGPLAPEFFQVPPSYRKFRPGWSSRLYHCHIVDGFAD